ncbi:hypothetical protein L2E82_45060 [Cichorium intybus]|uniref:Uncharacterized protein n=1 Tax=Cichorium intybus TaxID=13427 RepID=A0ACB8ZQZ3_CICIN|nr:hypothetical protein L2E82_45060 [Cichorium intybus]
MVEASTENQVAAENGGDGCKSTAFELEALIDSSGVSFHQRVGVLHILLNRVSKWCVLLSYSELILLRHDDVALWAVLLVDLECPKIEIRYQNLNVETFVHVGSRALPTITNFIVNMTEALLRQLKIYKGKRRKLTILDDVSGIIRPSRMTLLLGPPSSGKTTLMLALAGRLGHHKDMLMELTRREKIAGIRPDEDLDIFMKKRPRSSAIVHDQCVRNLGTTSLQEDNISNSGTINSKDNDTTMMTWPSSDSPNQSLKSKNTDDDSACQYGSENQEEECRTEGETVRSQSSRRSRAAAIHNRGEAAEREKQNKEEAVCKAEEYKESATQKAKEAKDTTIGKAGEYKDYAAQKASEAADKADEYKDYTTQKAKETTDTTVQKAKEVKDTTMGKAGEYKNYTGVMQDYRLSLLGTLYFTSEDLQARGIWLIT